MSEADLGIRQSQGSITADDRPLSDQERLQVQRFLSDPFSFPLQFKTWLVSYLESSDMTLPISAILGLTALLGISGAGHGSLGILPAGLILPYAGANAPTGSVLCDGSAYSRATEARLYAAIGVTYGAPDGNSFSVPDLRGRMVTGLGPHANVAALGQNEALPPGQRRPQHQHSPVGWESEGMAAGGSDLNVVGGNYQTNEQGTHTHGPADAPVDTPAFLVLNYVIVK